MHVCTCAHTRPHGQHLTPASASTTSDQQATSACCFCTCDHANSANFDQVATSSACDLAACFSILLLELLPHLPQHLLYHCCILTVQPLQLLLMRSCLQSTHRGSMCFYGIRPCSIVLSGSKLCQAQTAAHQDRPWCERVKGTCLSAGFCCCQAVPASVAGHGGLGFDAASQLRLVRLLVAQAACLALSACADMTLTVCSFSCSSCLACASALSAICCASSSCA